MQVDLNSSLPLSQQLLTTQTGLLVWTGQKMTPDEDCNRELGAQSSLEIYRLCFGCPHPHQLQLSFRNVPPMLDA